MSPVGHTLTGMAIGVLAVPTQKPLQRAGFTLFSITLLAHVPDVPLPFWGHADYQLSHSLFVNLGLMVVAALAFGLVYRQRAGVVPWRLLAAGTTAWLSHFLLDSFYNHGRGVAIYWPISTATLALPLPWFTTVKGNPPPLDATNLKIYAIELAFYLPLVLLAFAWRWQRAQALQKSNSQ